MANKILPLDPFIRPLERSHENLFTVLEEVARIIGEIDTALQDRFVPRNRGAE
jgi:hypothetical protein